MAAGIVAAGTGATAQPGFPLSPSAETRAANGLPAFRRARDGSVAPPPVFLPPASGAGRTGYNSTNTRKKTSAAKPKIQGRQPVVPPSAPLQPVASPYQRPLPPAAANAMAAHTPIVPVGALTPPVTKRRKNAAEGDPYDALGLRAGAFYLYPAVELFTGYNTNPAGRTATKGAVLYTVAPELRAQSNWSRHELKADLRGSYTYYNTNSTPSLSRPLVDGKVDARVDVSRNTRLDLGGRVLVTTDYPNSPNLQAGLSRLPISVSYGDSPASRIVSTGSNWA